MSTVDDEKVSQFMAFTGSADPDRAASYLEMSGGNVETAVGLYMEHEQGPSSFGSTAAAPAASMMYDDNIRAPDATRTMRLMDDHGVHVDPSYQLMNAMMEQQLTQSAFAAPLAGALDTHAVLNAAATANDADDGKEMEDDDYNYEDDDDDDDDDDEDEEMHVAPAAPARLSDMFAPPTHLLQKGLGFKAARTMAKDSRRWLLVNIQRDSEFASHALNRDVWRDELVENLIREGFIFWQQLDTTPEGRTYIGLYKVNDFPHVSFIDPRTGRLMWRKEGWTLENPLTAEDFAELAMDFCSRNSFDRPPQAPRSTGAPVQPSMPAKRALDQMSEEEQLQFAMKASIEEGVRHGEIEVIDADDEADEKPPAATAAAAPATAADVAVAEAPRLIDDLLHIQVGEEPTAGARMQLKMPDGKRIVRKFANDNTVKILYAFIAQSSEEAQSGKEFVVMAGFPPKDLIDDIEKTVEECNLSGQTITVRWKS